MNKEIIKILNELLEIPQSTNGTINFYSIESNKFEAIITLVKKQLEYLESQLEEKDKIINKIRKALTIYKDVMTEGKVVNEINYILEILERGKNVNSK